MPLSAKNAVQENDGFNPRCKKVSKRMSAFQIEGNNSENHVYLCWKLQAVSVTVFLSSSSRVFF